MGRYGLTRLFATIAGALVIAGLLYISHPEWFTNKSVYSLPTTEGTTPTPAIAPPIPTPPKPTPTPSTPRIGMTQHLDDIWITPLRIDHSQGTRDIQPNLGDEFIVIHLRIRNRSQVDYPVRTSDFQVLDGNGAIDPPLAQDFTRMRLREVRLIPKGHIDGTLIFEVPLKNPAARLIYQHDALDPSKRKEWILG
jgi:uncharacterized protein DUF4352